MQEFVRLIKHQFQEYSNKDIAFAQAKYMKNIFEFYGIKTPLRRELQKPFLIIKYLPPKEKLAQIVKELWLKPQRELHYFSQELVKMYSKQFKLKDIELFEFMIINNSWWDTVDFIAINLLGNYFKMYPKQIKVYVEKWLMSDNIWLQRSAILFQLKYKHDIDTILLSKIIERLSGSKDVFIKKAIGWILREYGKLNPNWVLEFVSKRNLSNLSKREALRLIK